MNAKAAATKVCPGCGASYPPEALFCPNDGSPLQAGGFGTFGDEGASGRMGSGAGTDDSYLGREISGHIQIRALAGVGAMGRVYRAFQRGIDRDVAVKVLHRELSANQQLVTRFHREAKVASRLQHPNVVQVHLAGQLPDGAMYIVMEYLDGVSLQAALGATPGALPLERALHIALQVCDAAGEAHAQGVVHRDIKPENVMLVRRGDDSDYVKVLDFGIARLNWGEQSMATAAGLIFGTARYISPEGAQGEAVGPAGDVYAIATLLYQMLAARTPFEGEQAVALLVQQIHDAPPPLRSLAAASAVPEAIAAVIMQNLSKVPSERAPDARTFGRALVEAARTVGLTAEDLVPRSSLFVPPARLSEPGSPPREVAKASRYPDLARLGPAAALPPTGKTQRWNPPSSPSLAVARTQSQAQASVDPTLDESNPVHATPAPPAPSAPGPAAPRVRTEPALPIGLTAAPQRRADVEPARVQVAEPDEPPPRSRLAGVMALCFVVGMLGAALVLYRMGVLGGDTRDASLDAVVAHADEALRHRRWDAPPGDNLRDLTTDGLARWPHDARLLDLRARATDELVKEAVGRKFAGEPAAGLHLARLASELDPTDTTAQHLVEEYERESRPVPEASASAKTPPSPPRLSRPPQQVAVPAPRVAIDASAARPKVGQPVTFTARLGSAPLHPVEDARFVINGPGLAADTRLGTLPGGPGVYSATFAGLEPGKYEVVFDGRLDGATLHATRTVVLEADGPASVPSSAPPANGTPPVPSGKWL